MTTRSFELRELFHLALLRHLAARLSGRSYAVKGGICLRLFHRSPRLSEDMDVDVTPQLRVETLRGAVDAVLGGRALLAALLPLGVRGLSASAPKQTGTTQRWKVALELGGGGTLRTKVEFSRRRDPIRSSAGVPDAELLRRYGLAPFAVRHYDAAGMAAQKMLALASPARNALRDLFDLHHLFFTAGARPQDAAPLVGAAVPAAAGEKVLAFTFEEFRAQVVPYLTPELVALYEEPALFERQKGELASLLIGMMG